jgi:hypothetical protein
MLRGDGWLVGRRHVPVRSDGSSLSLHAVDHFNTTGVVTAAPNEFHIASC